MGNSEPSTVDPTQPGRRPRQRNPRGQGARLREEIIAAATRMLEATGSEESLTLRGIAREVGIAAPSIDRHFRDRTEIIDAVVAQELAMLRDAMIVAALAHRDDPVARLHALTRAVYDHGVRRPNSYRVVFERRYLPVWEEQQQPMETTAPLIAQTFDLVVDAISDCVAAGASTSSDPFGHAVALWCAVHGLVALPPTIPSFPWPDLDALLTETTASLTRLTSVGPSRARRPRSVRRS